MIKSIFGELLAATAYLTRLPIAVDWLTQEQLQRSNRWFSWVGVLVGTVAAFVMLCFTPLFGQLLAAAISLVVVIAFTGAFHQDGLADTCDGFWGGWSREHKLAIMKDNQIGTYGVLALISAFTLQLLAMASLPMESIFILLICVHSGSRTVAGCIPAVLPYVRKAEEGKTPQAAQSPDKSYLPILISAPLLSIFLLPVKMVISLLLCWCGCFFIMKRLMYRHIGGYSGDTLGAAQQLTEIASLLTLLACSA